MVTNFKGEVVLPQVGNLVLVDNWGLCGRLLKPSEWDAAEYRIESVRIPNLEMAVNIVVAGRTLQKRPYQEGFWVRIKIVFVHDGEPNVNHAGWMLVA